MLQAFPRRCHPVSPLPSSSAPRALSADLCVPPGFQKQLLPYFQRLGRRGGVYSRGIQGFFLTSYWFFWGGFLVIGSREAWRMGVLMPSDHPQAQQKVVQFPKAHTFCSVASSARDCIMLKMLTLSQHARYWGLTRSTELYVLTL